jgi:hypothetical protein
VCHTGLEGIDQARDRSRLVAGGLLGGYELETFGHGISIAVQWQFLRRGRA